MAEIKGGSFPRLFLLCKTDKKLLKSLSILRIVFTSGVWYNIITIREGKPTKPKGKKKVARVDIDKNIKAKNIEKAAEKFAKVLTEKGYEWAANEMIETVENGYHCCSNAMEHNLIKGKVTSPKTGDWTYYWAIENIDGNEYYAWFIDREYK